MNFINTIKRIVQSRIFVKHFRLYLSIFIISFIFSTIVGYTNIDLSKKVMFYVVNFTSLKYANGEMIYLVINNFSISILLMYFYYLEWRLKKYFGIFYFIYNGFVAGIAVSIAALKYNIIIAESLILPHGIIEIPSIVLAVSGGLALQGLKNEIKEKKIKEKKIKEKKIKEKKIKEKNEENGEIFREFIYLAILLLMLISIAGYIESNITPYIFDSLMRYYGK